MSFDLQTLHILLVGALCLAAAFSLWESTFALGRSSELRLAASGYAALALGCLHLPRMADSPAFDEKALSPIFLIAGQALILAAVAPVAGEKPPKALAAGTAAAVVFWLALGTSLPEIAWAYAKLACVVPLVFATAALLWRGRRRTRYRSQPVAAAAFLGLGSLLVLRAPLFLLLPPDSAHWETISGVTMTGSVLFAIVAPVLIVTMAREERESQLLTASRTDFLTGLNNRRAFLEGCAGAKDRAARSVMLVDLDHFKRVNDTYGHGAGDEVLKIFARVAAAELPPAAVLARLGGEEFAAVVPGGAATAAAAAERLASRFTEATRRLDCTGGRPVTASIGIAELPAEDNAVEIALRIADRALYAAKAGGRDRVEIAGSGVVVPLPASASLSAPAPRPARRPWWTGAAG